MSLFARDGDLQIFASVLSHQTPTDPNSGVRDLLGSVQLTRLLSQLGLDSGGFVGLASWAKSAVVNSSITRFVADELCD